MSNFGDYIDGVPVKVSERYKRPPRIDLPYTVQDCLSRAQNFVDDVKCTSSFEKNVLLKLKELRSLKQTKKIERKHRLQLHEEAKQKKLDAIAVAEAKEKLKQLSVSKVSYPSTEEISAIAPGERIDEICEVTLNAESSPKKDEQVTNDENYAASNNDKETQLNILQPILVQSNYQLNNLLDDPDPLQNLKMKTKATKIHQFSNVDTLTFKDFENDTSSPFDNVELKTINDMELLAQVLQTQRDVSNCCNDPHIYLPDQQYAMIPNCGSQAQLEEVAYLPNAYIEQPIQGHAVVYSPPQNYNNGYYNVPSENVCDNNLPMININSYEHNYQYYTPSSHYPHTGLYYNGHLPVNCENSQLQNDSNYVPQPYYFYPQAVEQYPIGATALPTDTTVTQVTNAKESSHHQNRKTTTRSVPDIFKELNEELATAKRNINERSHNASPAAPRNFPNSRENKFKKTSRRNQEPLPNPYENMPPALQRICQKIHGMGFPLDRVARVCVIIGDNDKKIIEALLILGEIMDLGFSESKASSILVKHGFNRDKALDELVS